MAVSWEGARMIVVRDRRRPQQFSIHNLLIDEWYPILQDVGYVLYSFYVRLANRKDERAFPGCSLIRQHFGYGRATIWNYNRLLVWCGLVEIVAGNERSPNQYFILEVPKCDEAARERLCRRARAELDVAKKHEAKLLALVLGRVEVWRPIQDWWDAKSREKFVTVTRAQLEMDLQGGVVLQENQGGSAGEPGQFSGRTRVVPQENQGGSAGEPEQSEKNNPKKQSEGNNPNKQEVAAADFSLLLSILKHRGVDGDVARWLMEQYGCEVVRRQVDMFSYRLTDYWERGKAVENEAGLLVRSIEGDWSAPASYLANFQEVGDEQA